MRRIVTTVLVALGTIVVPASLAGATAPQRTPPTAFEVEIPFPDVCDFSMTATVRGMTHSITFLDANGDPVRGFAGGQLFVAWVRDDNGFSRTFSIAGPTFYDASGAAVRGTGSWTTPLAGTGWVLAHGNLTFDGLQDGFSLIASMNGRSEAICDLMS